MNGRCEHTLRLIIGICCALLFFTRNITIAQSKLTLSAGASASFGGSYITYNPVGRWSADLELDTKVMGSLHVVTGLSTFGVGYASTDSTFGSYTSTFKSQYVGVPVMARWNIGNRNFVYIDMGFLTYYLASAHLSESIDKHGLIQHYDGNITPYLNRLYVGFKVQFGFTLNRFSITDFFIYQFKGQETINSLADHWGLNAVQSTYLSSNGYSDFRAFGIKIGYRLR